MEGKWLSMFAAACFALLAAVGGAQAQNDTTDETQIESFLPSPPEPVLARSNAVSVAGQVETSRIPPGVSAKRIVVDLRDGAATPAEPSVTAAGPAERLLYSNTLGRVAVDFGANRLIADDVTITSTGRDGTQPTCRISKFAFQVDGRVLETMGSPSGQYTVNWALYNTCPYAVTAGLERNSRIIPGSSGSLVVNDDSPMWIEVIPAAPVFAYTNMWLGVQFNRANAGMVSGTPAQVGHSTDIIDFPGSACTANLGGFPNQPHASFNIEIWGDDATCPPAYVAYKNLREAGAGLNAGGTQEADWLTDDISLQNPCTALGFTVGVRAPGTYLFELRASCGSPAISGFQQTQLVGQSSGQEPRVFEYLFDNPIPLGQNISYAVHVNNLNAGAIVTGSQASIGQTFDFFEIAPECNPEDRSSGMDGLHFSLICQGPAPVGACCDMFITECDAGLLDGELCEETADCQPVCNANVCKIGGQTILVDGAPVACTSNAQCPGGTCISPCREIPQTNCPFPPRFTALKPAWSAGKFCANDAGGGVLDPFPNLICGQAACCYADSQQFIQCDDLTPDECDLQEPVNEPRQWQRGRICSETTCPIPACLGRQGGCYTGAPHPPGCEDGQCCSEVCADDDFCCTIIWDEDCETLAIQICEDEPANDTCGPTEDNPNAGAEMLPVPAEQQGTHLQATALDLTDPAICCHNGLPLMCQDGDLQYQNCTEDDDCRNALNPNATCGERIDKPFASLWYKFVATQTSARIETCNTSSTSATDSVLQVFAVGDPNATTDAQACPSLVPIACADDGCGFNGKLSSVCVEGLIPGKTYYIVVGGKGFDSRGRYKLTISSSACSLGSDVNNDWCHRGDPLPGGTQEEPALTAFNMANTTFNCPGATCAPTVEKDMWYDYTANCTGTVTIDTCAMGNPATNLAAFDGCECPSSLEPPKACSTEGPVGCATIQFGVVAGQCYKVLLGNEGANTPTGQIRVACDTVCPNVTPTFNPPSGLVDAGVPIECGNSGVQKGITQVVVTGLPAALENPAQCFVVDCETNPFGVPNQIALINGVVEGPPGTYTVTLAKPLSPNGVTQLRYLGKAAGDPTTRARYTTHLGNVDGDFAIFVDMDTDKLVDFLDAITEGTPPPVVQWGSYGTDINRSGATNALDLWELMNVLNGTIATSDPICDYPPPPELRPGAETCPL